VPEEPTKSDKPSLEKLLSQFGVSSDFAQKVRFRGPVGKIALVGVICAMSLGAIGARSSNPFVEGLCASLAAVVVLATVGGILWYSDKHPNEATLEGMEVVVFRQQQAWAAKGSGGGPAGPVIPNPDGAPPQINPPIEGEDA
jgi:hypothetical protein